MRKNASQGEKEEERMGKRLAEIAQWVQGTLRGDPERCIRGVAGIEDAGEEDITFLAAPRYLSQLATSRAAAVIVPPGVSVDRDAIEVSNPYLAFARLLELFYPPEPLRPQISERAYVAPSARLGQGIVCYPFVYIDEGAEIGDGVVLYPGVFIGRGVKIGPRTVLYPNVSVYPGVRIGADVIIHSGAVIGADGFGFTRDEQGEHYRIPQVGTVQIEDRVEIGANVCIDRATLKSTIIRRGTKIDNLVHIAHNVEVGAHSLLLAQVGIAGSVRVGEGVTLAGQVGVLDHVTIGDQAVIIAQSGVAKDVPPRAVLTGSPAIDHRHWRRVQSCIPRLPDLVARLRHLEQRIAALEKGEERP
ncbi:MAG: UDP-3-O-(3-hydroxymyristoyl)glucosamine N-acyltransferase [Nitrospinota bacterium]|nr:MAG: UDP-3-O-(3-hydroxymyristoyl)glucosamine N-acyltransferase [Nitrospinota bacterium]